MSATERRPFNAKEVAEVLKSGRIVALGDGALLQLKNDQIACSCRLCDAQMSIPCDPSAASLADDAIAFILKHRHVQGAAS